MDSRELWFRGRERALTWTERFQYSWRSPRWARERLSSRLSPVTPDMSRAQHALDRHDWRVAGNALRSHFTRRPSRFPINWDKRVSIVASIREQFPDSAHEARDRADRLVGGSCELLGYHDVPVGSRDHIDWHLDPVHQRRPPMRFWASVPYLDAATGDHKVIWETNRHQRWLTLGRAAWLTGDRHYSDAFKVELTSWLQSNPPLAGINWASMLELGFRSLSWIWSLHFFVALDDQTSDSTWLIDLLLGVDAQLNHIARHLSRYFSPNTHLLGEGLALYIGGLVLPELRGASTWTVLGRQILVEEARRQVNADGGHAELSTHYHRYALDFYLLALVIARLTGDPAAREFSDVASRLATFCRSMVSDNGVLPTIGDDDGGSLFPICGRPAADASDSLSLAAALLQRPELAVGDPPEETLWMLGGDRTRLQWPDKSFALASTLFTDTGYAVLRGGAAHAIVDVGRHGFLNGGHAHADALSIVMSIDGRPLLVDPGTSTYTMDPGRRDLYRSTAMHNTATIDGRPQSIPASPFHWKSSANARVRRWRPAPEFDFLEAEHDGYAPHLHRRSVLRIGSEIWFIADHVLGEGDHEVAIYWHLDPSWQLQRSDGGVVSVRHHDGVSASIASTATRFTHTEGGDLGWHAPVYGQHQPTLTLTAREKAAAPFSVLTVISAGTVARPLSIQRVPLAVDHDDSRHRVAVIGDFLDGRFIALFGTETTKGPLEERPLQTVELGGNAFHTDARIAVLGLSATQDPLCLTLIDASHARWTGRNPFSLGPFTSAADLHLDQATVSRLSHKSKSRAPMDRMEPTTCAE
jgi:hypothetical protein